MAIMNSINSLSTENNPEEKYQYNYTHIEPLAMVDQLPQNEEFSRPWITLVGFQFLTLAVNTLIVNRGDQGKQGILDDVWRLLVEALVETFKEMPSLSTTLLAALISVLQQVQVKISKQTETVSPQISSESQSQETAVRSESKVEEISLAPSGQDLPSNTPEIEAAKSVEAALQDLVYDAVQSTTNIQSAGSTRGALEQSLPDLLPKMEKLIETLVQTVGENFVRLLAKNLLAKLMENSPSGIASTLENYEQLFATIEVPAIADTFASDEEFAYMRVAGPNPLMIERITTADDRFPVTEEQYQAVMGQTDSLQSAYQDGRIYLADYGALDGALNGTFTVRQAVQDYQKYAYAPLAMFAVPPPTIADRRLRPVAIQCGQSPEIYPIITSSTGRYPWLMAKTIVQIADANIHEAVSHLARTHLLVEPFVIATHRILPPQHPLHRLLVPHFQGTLAINNAAAEILVAPGGGVNQLLSSTIENSRVLAVKGLQGRGFNAEMLPRRLQERQVDDPAALPLYPYRDDALLVWKAIHAWVKAYLELYYPSDEAVQKDRDLQEWGKDLVAFNGGRLSDFGDDGKGQLQTRGYLADAVTLIIFTASAQHAAVNFPQKGIMSFAPAMPTAGYLPATEIGPDSSERDWLAMLPPLEQAQQQVNLLHLLGSVYFTQLGQYEEGHFADPQVTPLLQKFQADLQAIEQTIDERNKERLTYDYLKPSKIPQSINI